MRDQSRDDWDALVLGIDEPAADDARSLAQGSTASGDIVRATHEALADWARERAARELSDDATRAQVRDRLLRALASEERFRPFFAELGRLFSLDPDGVRALLRKAEDPSSYRSAPIPGVRFFHFVPGAPCGFSEAGVVKLDKGTRFPQHRHLGVELNFVLEGVLIDAGARHGPGSALVNDGGTEHDYYAGNDRDLLLIAGHNGIAYLEEGGPDRSTEPPTGR